MTSAVQGPGRGRAWALGLLAVLALIALLYGHWAQRTWIWQPDELEFRARAEWFTGGLPDSLWALDPYRRGIQRLSIWELGGSLWALGAPDGLRLARWIQVLAFVSTAAPVWLWARAAGAARGWAAWSAVLAIAVPWAVLGATFLTEPLAYPLTIWACFATWHTAVRPSVRADLLALLAVAAATLARTGLVQLGLVLVAVCLAQDLRLAPGGPLAALRVFPRRHLPICLGLAAGALVVLTGHATRFTGVYGEDGISVHIGTLWTTLTYVVAVVASGTAFVPLIAAIALATAQVVRPSDDGVLALGLVVPALLAVLVLSADLGGNEERYVFLLAGVCAVALAVGATRRDTPVWAVALAGALVGGALLAHAWRPELGPIGFEAFAAETFQARVVHQGLYSRLPNVLEVGLGPFRAVLVAVAAAAAGVLVCRPGPRAHGVVRVARVVVPAGLLVIGMAQAVYALSKFERSVRGTPLADRSWADRAGHGATMGVWLPPLGPAADVGPIWQEIRFFNVGAGPDVAWRSPLRTAFVGEGRVEARIDPRDGRLLAPPGAEIPRLMLVPRLPQPAPLRAEVVAQAPGLPVDLVRFTTPQPRVRWVVSGADADGWILAGRTARVRVFGLPGERVTGCVRLQVDAPPDAPAPSPGVARSAVAARRLTVAPSTPWSGTVPVRHRSGHADVAVRVAGSRPFPGGRVVSAHLTVLGETPCTRR